jgi:two-component system CheB/CheR fusion protein
MKNDNSDSQKLAIHYMSSLVDVAHEPFLILDADLKIVSANPTFYQNFQVSKEETEGKYLFDLGNGQWNIIELKKLLKDILPEKKVVLDYEVEHSFEQIGEKTMLLNAKQIDTVQLIILAIEDITYRKDLDERVEELQVANRNMVGRELKMIELKKEIERLKEK